MPTYQLTLRDNTTHNVRSNNLDAWLNATGLSRWLREKPKRLPAATPATVVEYPSPLAALWRRDCVRAAIAADGGTALLDVVLEILDDIESTGGVQRKGSGLVADPAWSDLAASYRKLCTVLGLEPVVER